MTDKRESFTKGTLDEMFLKETYPGEHFWLGMLAVLLLADGYFSLNVLKEKLLPLEKVHVGKFHFVFVHLEPSGVHRDDFVEPVHVELPDKAGHVVVLVVEREELPGKPCLISNSEADPIL